VCVDNHAVESMKFALTEFVPKSTTDVQHIHGAVQYCASAFNFDCENQTAFGELLACLSDFIANKPFKKWGDQEKDTCNRLYALIKNAPRAMSDPKTLLRKGTCFIWMSDCGSKSTAQSLHIVDCPCATMVTLDMLKDRSVSQLIYTKAKKRSGSKIGWIAFEGELKGMVDNVKDSTGIIITANRFYETLRSAEEAELVAANIQLPEGGIYKNGFFVDARTAMGTWKHLLLPKECTNFLSAKLLRMQGWIEDIAMMRYIRHTVMWQSGLQISLVHLISHMIDLVYERQEAKALGSAPSVDGFQEDGKDDIFYESAEVLAAPASRQKCLVKVLLTLAS